MVANTPPGPGVDASGQAVVDPTANVLWVIESETRRQDDLRQAAERLADAERRHAGDLREAESKRVDALRAGDQAAIVALAAQVAATAEAMRVSAAAQADQFTKALAEVQRWQYGQQGGSAQVQESRDASLSLTSVLSLAVAVLAVVASVVIALAR